MLVEADLRGVGIQGVDYTYMLLDSLKRGIIDGKAEPKIVHETAATILIDGNGGLGQPAALLAVDVAVKRARAAGAVIVAIRNSTDIFMIGLYAELIAREGAAIVTSSHNPAPWNGVKYKPEYAGSASPEIVARLEAPLNEILAAGEPPRLSLDDGRRNGLLTTFDPRAPYLARMGELVDLPRIRNAGLRIAVDSMYGAGQGYLTELLSGGSTEVVELHAEHNPLFPGIGAPEPITRNLGDLARTMNSLGTVALREGRLVDAEELFSRSLELWRSAPRPDEREIAGSLNNLAILAWQRADYAAAEDHYRQALAIEERRLGVEDPRLVAPLNNMGILLRDQERKYREDPKAADELLKIGESSVNSKLPKDQLAAWTTMASAVLNLDEAVTRN